MAIRAMIAEMSANSSLRPSVARVVAVVVLVVTR